MELSEKAAQIAIWCKNIDILAKSSHFMDFQKPFTVGSRSIIKSNRHIFKKNIEKLGDQVRHKQVLEHHFSK